MRKTSKGSKASLKAEQPAAGESADVKAKALNEMMERIKHGVVLRPVKSQESKPLPVCDEKPPESAMEELKGILEPVKRSSSRGSQEPVKRSPSRGSQEPVKRSPSRGSQEPVKRSPSRGSQEAGPSPTGKKDSELEVILRRRRNKAGEAGDERDGLMSHVSSSDSLNGPERTSGESGQDPGEPGGLSVPSDTRAGPERRGSGPGPVVARRRSSEAGKEPRGGSWQERRSCSSLSEKESLSNGCVHSAAETNGARPAEDVSADGEC